MASAISQFECFIPIESDGEKVIRREVGMDSGYQRRNQLRYIRTESIFEWFRHHLLLTELP